MTTKNTEFLRAITGPKIEYNGSPITRYSTWDIGGGIKVDENPFFGKLNLSIDDQHIIDLIDAHGGGTPDRIESPSGDSFAEATDDFFGMGTSAVISRANHVSGSAVVYTAILPGEGGPSHPVLMSSIAATNADETQSAGIGAHYDPTTDQFSLGAFGAPLDIAEPTAPNHAATKGYVDARPGAEEWSEHAATEDVDLDGHKITGLGDPTNPQDAATKAYVDANSGGGGGGVPWYTVPAQTNVNLNNYRITGVATPTSNTHAANKAYVDSAAGIASTISQGEFSLTQDTGNNSNVSDISIISRRYVRIDRTVILTGTIELKTTAVGQATAAFTGLPAAAQPANNYAYNTIIPDHLSIDDQRGLTIWVYPSGDIRFVVRTAAAGKTYRTSFVMMYFGKAI